MVVAVEAAANEDEVSGRRFSVLICWGEKGREEANDEHELE